MNIHILNENIQFSEKDKQIKKSELIPRMEREEMPECVPLELEACNCTETEESLDNTEEDEAAQSHLFRSQNNRNKRFSIMVEEDLLR